MAQIRKRGAKWHYRVWVKGKPYTGTTGLDATERGRKAAMQFAENKQAEILAELMAPKPEARSFKEASDEFLSWCFASEYRSKPNTARRIKTSFATLREFFQERDVTEITAGDVERYKSWRASEHQVRDITIRHDLHALSVFFGRFVRKFGWRSDNPVDDVKKPSDVDAIRIHVLSDEEESKYFSEARGNLYDVARLIILQGCRPEEIMALQQGDVNLGAGSPSQVSANSPDRAFNSTPNGGAVIHIRGGKTRAARRTLTLTGESIEILARRLAKPGKWLFPSSRNDTGHLKKLNSQHDQTCIDAGVSFCLYDLRHTFATRLADAGVPITTIAALLGHSGLRQVARYVHPSAEAQRDAMKNYEKLMKPRLKVVGR